MTPELGWARMEPILDQAMPVPQRSRRFILFWWTAAAVLAVGLIGYGTWMNRDTFTQPVAIETIHTTETPVVPQVDDANTTTDISTSAGTPTGIEQIEQQVSNSKTEIEKQAEPARSQPAVISPKKKSNISRSPDAGNISNNNVSVEPVVVAQSEEFTETENSTSDNIAATSSDVVASPENTSSSTTPATFEMQVLDPLPLTDVSWYTDREISMDIAHGEIKTSVMANKKMLSPYLTVSGLAGFEKGYGGHGGAGLDFAITPSVSLSADLGYAVYKPQGEVFEGLKYEADINSFVQNDLGYLGIGQYVSSEDLKTTSNAASIIAPLVETLTQYQCGLGLKINVSKKFFVEGGAILGFGSKGQSRYPIVSYDPYNVPANGTAYTIENSFDSYDVIRSTTASLYGSMGLRPSRKSEIFVQYRHALNSYLTTGPTLFSADGDRTDYIRGLNVGVRYHL